MTEHINSLYDPNWMNELNRCQENMREINNRIAECYRSNPDIEEISRLQIQANILWKQAVACHEKQHQTVREYAEWLFNCSPPNSMDPSISYATPIFSEMKSVEVVNNSYKQAKEHCERRHNEARYGLPAIQPVGLEPFSDPSRLIITGKTIRYPHQQNANVTLYIDEIDGNYHICLALTDPYVSGQRSLTNSIDDLATVIFGEAEAAAQANAPAQSILKRGWQRLLQNTNLQLILDPSIFHYYQHDPVTGPYREQFSLVTMDFNRDSRTYSSPRWHGFTSVPPVLKEDRSETAVPVDIQFTRGEIPHHTE